MRAGLSRRELWRMCYSVAGGTPQQRAAGSGGGGIYRKTRLRLKGGCALLHSSPRPSGGKSVRLPPRLMLFQRHMGSRCIDLPPLNESQSGMRSVKCLFANFSRQLMLSRPPKNKSFGMSVSEPINCEPSQTRFHHLLQKTDEEDGGD